MYKTLILNYNFKILAYTCVERMGGGERERERKSPITTTIRM
jgi:hypothetical protein